MSDTSVILFSPLCIDGNVDIPAIRGLLDVLAMNLQTYPDVYVKAPLFVVDIADEHDTATVSERKTLVWPSGYDQEELQNLIYQCGSDIENVLVPIICEMENDPCENNAQFSLELRVLNVTGNFAVYERHGHGTLVQITTWIAKETHAIVKALGHNCSGHEKWPITDNEQALLLFFHGVTAATVFQTGVGSSDMDNIIDFFYRAFELDNNLDLATYRLVGFLESIINSPDLPLSLYKKAMKMIRKLEALDTLPAPVHILIAEIYQNMGRKSRIVANLQKGLQKDPMDSEVVVALANFYEEQEELDKGKEVYETHLQILPDPSYLILHNLGAIYAEEGNLEKAVTYWCQSLKLHANYSNAYGNLMNAYLEMGEYSKMWVVLEEGLKHPPIAWHSYRHVVNNLDKIGDFSAGIESLQQYVTSYPQDKGGYLHLALAYSNTGQSERAIQILQQGLEQGYGETHHNDILRQLLTLKMPNFELGFERACDNVANNKGKNSIAFLKKCTKTMQEFWPAWFLLGKAYQQIKQYSKAIKAMEQAHKIIPDNPDIINEIGVVATLRRDHEYALEKFYHAVALAPLNLDYLANLALELLKAGKRKKAMQMIRRALAIKPWDKIAHDILGLIEGKMEEYMQDLPYDFWKQNKKRRRKRRKIKRKKKKEL